MHSRADSSNCSHSRPAPLFMVPLMSVKAVFIQGEMNWVWRFQAGDRFGYFTGLNCERTKQSLGLPIVAENSSPVYDPSVFLEGLVSAMNWGWTGILMSHSRHPNNPPSFFSPIL